MMIGTERGNLYIKGLYILYKLHYRKWFRFRQRRRLGRES